MICTNATITGAGAELDVGVGLIIINVICVLTRQGRPVLNRKLVALDCFLVLLSALEEDSPETNRNTFY